MANKTIIFEGGAAGEFLSWGWPNRNGVYKYMPFRSVSHLRLHERLRQTGSAQCYYERAGRKVFFSVVAHPKYGRLQLNEFRLEEQTAV